MNELLNPRCAPLLWLVLLAAPRPAAADVFRWDNGQLVPGTEGIQLGPGVRLEGVDLSFAEFSHVDLASASFRGANFTNAQLWVVNFDDADFTNALMGETSFVPYLTTFLTQEQLYSTASYQSGDLRGIDLGVRRGSLAQGRDLSGWQFSGQNLSQASLARAVLSGTNFTGANLSGADLRGSTSFTPDASATLRNTIWPDGVVHGLRLEAGESFLLRLPYQFLEPIVIEDEFSVHEGGVFELHVSNGYFESDLATRVRFDPDVVPELGGTLRLTSRPLYPLVGDMRGQDFEGHNIEFRLFDWGATLDALNRFDRIEVFPGNFNWDLSRLYTTGEIRLLPSRDPDYDANGIVDQADLDLVLLNWGSELFDPAGAGWINDLPTGTIDQQELDKVLLGWGNSVAIASSNSVGTPEPGSLWLVMIIVLVFAVGRRACRTPTSIQRR